jgi:alkaline phosphatase D
MRYLIFLLLLASFSTPSFAQLPANMYADQAHAPFLYGVASGDPLTDRLIIWTKIEPDSGVSSISVDWEISTDTNFTNIVNSGTLVTDTAVDWTVKIDVDQLSPYTTYFYRFKDPNNNYSAVGRGKTAPTGNSVKHIRGAVASCSSVYSGFFNAYQRIAGRKDLDFVIHLGDYIYDFVDADEEVRVPTPYPAEPTTLQEWRDRHAYYLLDPDLRAARQTHSWMVIWDNHDLDKGGSSYFGSIQAFWEYLPIRKPNFFNGQQIYRSLSFGDLLDMIFIDIFVWRDIDQMPGGDPSILGTTQFNWLKSELATSTANWRIIGNQKMMGGWSVVGFPSWFPLGNGQVLDDKSWDGYDESRDSLLSYLESLGKPDVLVLSGDAHVSMATDLAIDPYDFTAYNGNTGQGAVAAEFLPTSINRGNLDEMGIFGFLLDLVETASETANPQHVYSDLVQHGYGILDIKEDSIVAEFWYSDILNQTTSESFERGMILRAGENHWARDFTSTPMPDKVDSSMVSPTFITAAPWESIIYPNPSQEGVFNVKLSKAEDYQFELIQIDGKSLNIPLTKINQQHYQLNIRHLSKGLYILKVSNNHGEYQSYKLVYE